MRARLRSMLALRRSSPPKSKKGFLRALFFFYAAVRIIFDFWQGTDFAIDNASSLADYVATGPGNLAALVIGVFLIVWATYSQRSKSESTGDKSEIQQIQQPTSTTDANNRIYVKRWQELEQEKEEFRTKLQESEQERERLKRELEEAQPGEGQIGKLTVTGEDPLAVITRITAERDKLKEELESRKADAGFRGKIAYDSTEKARTLEEENEQLKAERDALSEEERRILQDHRRQRIEEWRSVIRNFDFDAERFTSTDAYSQMRPHLQPDVRRKLEHPGMVIVGNATRGEHAHRYMLLDEIARVEKEWGLV